MVTLAELAERDELTPSELKCFGKRVKIFLPEGVKSDKAKKEYFKTITNYCQSTGGELYTGIHSENDWTRTRWWSKGGHLVNRTLEFAVIAPK